jgi:hypothetical protein
MIWKWSVSQEIFGRLWIQQLHGFDFPTGAYQLDSFRREFDFLQTHRFHLLIALVCPYSLSQKRLGASNRSGCLPETNHVGRVDIPASQISLESVCVVGLFQALA